MSTLKAKFKDPILVGSAFFFFASIFSSFFSYLFQLISSRVLTISDYGILVSLFSLSTIVLLPLSLLNPAIVKKVSEYKAKERFDSITSLFVSLAVLFSILGGLLIFGINVFSPSFSSWIKTDDVRLIPTFSLFVAFSLVFTLPYTFLNGLLRFKGASFVGFLTSVLKLVLGIGGAVLLKGAAGSFAGLVLGGFFVSVVGFLVLRKNLEFPVRKRFDKAILKQLLKYALPASIIIIPLGFLLNIDMVLAKIILTSEGAGIYAGISIVGKILFYGVSSISLIILPLVSEKAANKKDSLGVLRKSVALVVFLLLAGIVFYSFFPRFVLRILHFDERFSGISPYLGMYSVFIALYAIINMFANYYMALSKFFVGYILLAGSVFYALSVTVSAKFFTTGISSLIQIGIICYGLILFTTLIYHFADSKKRF